MSERKRILITVRTYPVPETKGVEVSCTAGITEGQQWIRIFPIPYRFLQPDRREPGLAIVPGQAIRSAHPAPLNDRPGGPIPPPSQAGTVELPPTIAVIAVEVCRGQGPLRRGCPIRATPGQRRCNRLGLRWPGGRDTDRPGDGPGTPPAGVMAQARCRRRGPSPMAAGTGRRPPRIVHRRAVRSPCGVSARGCASVPPASREVGTQAETPARGVAPSPSRPTPPGELTCPPPRAAEWVI